jgi:hypothetical protein
MYLCLCKLKCWCSGIWRASCTKYYNCYIKICCVLVLLVFVPCLVHPMLPLSLDCPLLILLIVFSNVCFPIPKVFCVVLCFCLSSSWQFSGVHVTRSFGLCECLIDRCLFFSPISFGRFRLLTTRWHLQAMCVL